MESIGFLGLGIMGSRMAANLRRAGYELTVFNRTRERAEAFAQEHGATVADTPAAVGAGSDIVITMVVDGDQVRELLLGEDGVAGSAADGLLCVDMSTIAPGQARAMAAELRERGIGFVDAPVTGSSPKAEDGTLTIMAGGDAAAYERAKPLFEVMAAGSGASAMLDLKAGPMLEHDFEPLFKLAHMLKDVRHALTEADRLGAEMKLGKVAEHVYTQADRKGLGEQDFAAVVEVVEGSAG